jgi:hypothetical protein
MLNYFKRSSQMKEVIKMAKRKKNDCGCGCLPLKKKGRGEPKPEVKKSEKLKQ